MKTRVAIGFRTWSRRKLGDSHTRRRPVPWRVPHLTMGLAARIPSTLPALCQCLFRHRLGWRALQVWHKPETRYERGGGRDRERGGGKREQESDPCHDDNDDDTNFLDPRCSQIKIGIIWSLSQNKREREGREIEGERVDVWERDRERERERERERLPYFHPQKYVHICRWLQKGRLSALYPKSMVHGSLLSFQSDFAHQQVATSCWYFQEPQASCLPCGMASRFLLTIKIKSWFSKT